MPQLTKRQWKILQSGLLLVSEYIGAGALAWDTEADGPMPVDEEVDALAQVVGDMPYDEEPDDDPMKDGKPYITDAHRVVSAMLLTDMCMVPGNPLEQDIDAVKVAVDGWTPDERAAAFEWAACAHLKAGDNDDVVVPPCPPHVQKLRPKYGAD